ncbi:putative xanthine dehydrogenase HxA [Meredithblackwellia eburnea MCA 4105]
MPGINKLSTFEALNPASTISFFLNGSPIKLNGNNIDPDSTLLDFIRSQGQGHTGTKLGCGEGGCGACTVVLQSRHPITRELQHLAINACLAPIVSVDGKHVITVEGLGNSDSPHPLQERLWKLSGSQCGFCTPGIVMSIYALLRNSITKGKLTIADVELEGVLDGNLCRCTGYKPILDAAKSFVGDYLGRLNGGAVDKDLIIPINWAAANMDEGEAVSTCCKKDSHSAKEGAISSDQTLTTPSAKDTAVPPIDKESSLLGRTAPVEDTEAVKEAAAEASSSSDSSTDSPPSSPPSSIPPSETPPKPKGCGRADCCQLAPSTTTSSSSTKPQPVFPRFELKPYQPHTELIYPPSLSKHEIKPLKIGSDERVWLRPTTLEQLVDLKAKLGGEAKLVGGSSEVGIEVHIIGRSYPISIYVGDIPELAVSCDPSPALEELSFGANLPLTSLNELCNSLLPVLPANRSSGLKAIQSQLRYFAGFQIRNVAGVGGNIATASPISDLNPVWVATQTKVVVRSLERGEEKLRMDDFFIGYRKTRLPLDAVIVRLEVPLTEGVIVKAYKQAKRKDDDIAIVTAAFAMKVEEDGLISHVKFGFGGMAAWTISTPKTEQFLQGKAFTSSTLESALDVLGTEIDLPYNVPGGMPSYRKTLALSFFFKFWNSVAYDLDIPFGDSPLSKDSMLEIVDSIHRKPSSGRRDNSDPYAAEVVGKQEPHASGLKHVTGEAVYVDDMPKVGNEGYGALVLSKRAHAKILNVDPSAALEVPGVIAWVDHNDLPNPRANYWGAVALDEVFFAVDEVVSYGQPIGLVVASSKIIAQKAARLVKVDYEDMEFILTIEEAIGKNSFHEQYDRRIERGDPIDDALEKAENVLEGSTRMGGQEHFYLETMASLVIPKLEGGEMEVWSSTQSLTDAQRWVSQVTGVPRNRIVAKVKRLGGGFGGKESRASLLTAIVAVAAKKCRRPVRSMLDRYEDISITGQRHPCLAQWKVGFTNEGKLTALKTEFFANGGYSLDISGGVVDRALAHLDNSYFIPHVAVHGRICKTNTVSNTAFRGFGGPQGMIVAEHYLEAIAHKLNLNIDDVRTINLYKEGEKTPYHQQVLDWHVPRLLKDCREESEYDRRRVEVDKFNKEHKWRKRGLVLVPTKFGLAFGVKAMNQGTASVLIYMDGSVLVAHGGTEMGQGLYTKCCQIAAQELGVPLEAVFTSESASNTIANAVPTAASAGSDLNGYAVFNACKILKERLEPYRQKLGPDATFSSVVAAAWADRISLQAVGHHATPNLGYEWNNQKPSGNLFHYFTQGVAACEVEVDTLTGDHTVLRTDIKMDVGKSLNPAIDYGQIEGAYVQGQGWCTTEESLWFGHSGAIATLGPGAYKIPGFSDIPQEFNVSLLRDAEWPNLGSIKASKGIGEPPFFLGCAAALAIRDALKSAREDAGVTDLLDFRMPMTSERIRLACADPLLKKGTVAQKEGQKPFFVHI